MDSLGLISLPSSFLSPIQTRPPSFETTKLYHPSNLRPISPLSSICWNKEKFKLYSTLSSTVSAEPSDPSAPEAVAETETGREEEEFDWFSNWYPLASVCDLDKRVPHAKRVMGLDVVVWWDRNEGKWQVFDDSCPHRLAPLSEGRIDQWGRLQCVYHGWCFNGAGDCKLIPQAPPDGPPVHTFKKACAAVYPSFEQNDIVWFWPSTAPQHKDIHLKIKPPYIQELDDPSFSKSMGTRDIAYGYEVLIENLMDPSHVPYAHLGLMRVSSANSRTKVDREGGRPLEINVQKLDKNGFFAKQEWGYSKFISPCVFYAFPSLGPNQGNGSLSSAGMEEQPTNLAKRRMLLIFICVPVSPGKSRLIWSFPRNFGVWMDRIIPRWIFHIGQNLILDSDLYLLHLEEHKINDIGPSNWQKACFVPTKADALVVAYRKWLRKYSGGQVNWGTKFSGALPPTPPKEQLLDRYWSHVVNCSSCSVAIKGLKVLEVALQVFAIASIGIVAAIKEGALSYTARSTMVSMAVICFVVSRWLSHFIYKNFYFHDYNHGFK